MNSDYLNEMESNINWYEENNRLEENVNHGYKDTGGAAITCTVGGGFLLIGSFMVYESFRVPMPEGQSPFAIYIFVLIGFVVLLFSLLGLRKLSYANKHEDDVFVGVVTDITESRSSKSGRVYGRVIAYRDGANWKSIQTVMVTGFRGYEVGDLVQLIEYKGKVRYLFGRKVYRTYSSFYH